MNFLKQWWYRLSMYLSGITTFGPIRAYRVALFTEQAVAACYRIGRPDATNAEIAWLIRWLENNWHARHKDMEVVNLDKLARIAPEQVQKAGM